MFFLSVPDPLSATRDLWVLSSTCQGCETDLVEPSLDGSKASFNSQASTSYQATSPQQPVQLEYAGGSSIAGIVAQDKVTIGDLNTHMRKISMF
jgi:Eukaryotic aspartyl protease